MIDFILSMSDVDIASIVAYFLSLFSLIFFHVVVVGDGDLSDWLSWCGVFVGVYAVVPLAIFFIYLILVFIRDSFGLRL